MRWLKQLDFTTFALVLGPILMVVALWSVRSRLWGPALEEIRVLIRQDDELLKGIDRTQREILDHVRHLKLDRCSP